MLGLGKLWKGLVGLGHLLGKLIGGLRELATDERFVIALDLIHVAYPQFPTNLERREWVSQQLQAKLHLSETDALLLLQLAMKHLKAGGV